MIVAEKNLRSGLRTKPRPIDREFGRCLVESVARPVRSMLRWAEEEIVAPPGGPYAGESLSRHRQPVMRLLLAELDNPHWWTILGTGCSQAFKTLGLHAIPIGYHACELRETVVIGVPDMRMANNKWQRDLAPMFRASPALRQQLPISGPGSKGGVVKDEIVLANGSRLKWMSAGGKDTSKAGYTSRVAAVTEAAGFSAASDTSVESGPLRQIKARQRAFPRHQRRTYIEGTVTLADQLPWIARQQSSQSRIVTPCPHCQAWIAPERGDLVGWQEAETESEVVNESRFHCPECGESIDDEQRRSVLTDSRILHGEQTIDAAGNVSGDLPDTHTLWFRFSAWHNAFTTVGDIAFEEWSAARSGDEESEERRSAEREMCQFVWAIPWTPPAVVIEPLTAGLLEARMDPALTVGAVPDDCQWLVVAADCGMYKLHWVCVAFCSSGRLHVVAYDTIGVLDRGKGDAQTRRQAVRIRLRSAIEELRQRCLAGWQHRGTAKRPDAVPIDASYLPNVVFGACREIDDVPLTPYMGRGTGQLDGKLYLEPKRVNQDVREIGEGWHVRLHKKHRMRFLVGHADHWKSQVHDALLVDVGEPGALTVYGHHPQRHKTLERHLLAGEQRQRNHPRHGPILEWHNPLAKPDHYGDAMYEALLAGNRLGWRADPHVARAEARTAPAEPQHRPTAEELARRARGAP